MTEADQARAALDDVRVRERQVQRTVEREASVWWWPASLLVLLATSALVLDVADLLPEGPLRTALPWITFVAGLAVIAVLHIVVLRLRRVRPRHEPRRATVRLFAVLIAYLVTFIVVGTVLRGAGVGWDATLSALAGVAVAVAVGFGVEAAHRRTRP